MQVQPYVIFNGRCEEALNFYVAALGAQISFMIRFKESPDAGRVTPENSDKIMHATLQIGNTTLFASDGQCSATETFSGFSLSISTTDLDAAGRMFNALAEGGTVRMPLAQTFWSPGFGMLVDRFGLSWMVNVEAQK